MAAHDQKKVHRAHNFYAGPAALPEEVLLEAQRDMLNYNNSGMSIMELSHRSKTFEKVIADAERDIRTILNVPDTYAVLFMQGGGTGQFAAIPMNLLGDKDSADYVITGSWSQAAAKEASKYCKVNIAASSEVNGKFSHVPPVGEWKISPDAAYLYLCENETVMGVQFSHIPKVPDNVTLVADVSSSFMSAPLDVTKFGLIYAGAQKNIGPAGLTIVIVRKDLLNKAKKTTPTVLDYTITAAKESMYNTPPCWSIYMCGLVFKWILKQGGLEALGKVNNQKAALIYGVIDKRSIYMPTVDKEHRSIMNIVFRIGKDGKVDEALEKQFVSEGQKRHLIGLDGHRSVGGIRASLYNAVSLTNCDALAQFMEEFAKSH